MLFALLSSVLLVGTVWAAVDQNCTTYDGATSKFLFAESAVNCEDKLSSTNCALLYQNPAVAGNEAERDPKCSGDPISQGYHARQLRR
ncbi:hypothetical protein OSTOST_21377 [Ostertagia ostertagi]